MSTMSARDHPNNAPGVPMVFPPWVERLQVKNVLAAGEADVHFIRKDVHIASPRIVRAGSGAEGLPSMARLQARRIGVLVADIA